MNNGWIKLHRKLTQNPIYKESRAVHVWIECLLRASHSGNVIFLKKQRVTLTSGQFAMGREEFGASVCMSPSTAWHWILQFEADKMIDIRKTRGQGSIVTIKNWKEHQVDKDVDIKKTSVLYKQEGIKNEENEGKVKIPRGNFVLLSQLEMEKLTRVLGESRDDYIERLDLYIGSKGKQKEYKDHYLTILAWWKRDHPSEPQAQRAGESLADWQRRVMPADL